MVAEPVFDPRPADLSRVPPIYYESQEQEERRKYAALLTGRMFQAVFPGGVPLRLVQDDAVWLRAAEWRARTGIEHVLDRFLAGQAEVDEFNQAMIAQKLYWERVAREGRP
jgi:hypothetical protein